MGNELQREERGGGREAEMLVLAAQGFTDKQIARHLGISEDTVDTYWRRIRQRYNASSRTEAVAKAVSQALNEEVERERAEKMQLAEEMVYRAKAEAELMILKEQLEDRVRERTAELESANQRMECAICLLNCAGVVLWEASPEDPLNLIYLGTPGGEPVQLTDIVHPDDLDVLSSIADAAMAQEGAPVERRFRVRGKDSRYSFCREYILLRKLPQDMGLKLRGVRLPDSK